MTMGLDGMDQSLVQSCRRECLYSHAYISLLKFIALGYDTDIQERCQ